MTLSHGGNGIGGAVFYDLVDLKKGNIMQIIVIIVKSSVPWC